MVQANKQPGPISHHPLLFKTVIQIYCRLNTIHFVIIKKNKSLAQQKAG
jgi:hypothetical protein